jgi:hypothetical protein
MDGDFRNDACKEILKECDIVITNPPFSLFRDFMDWIISHDKQFLVVANQNAISYKEIFPLFKENKMRIGYNKPKAYIQPDGTTIKAGDTCWMTSLPVNQVDKLSLTKTYNPENYPKYDNYDAIEVGRVANIPKDYNGVMGVPITFLYKYNPDQFEIVKFRKGDDNKDLRVNGKDKYARILIKRKEAKANE